MNTIKETVAALHDQAENIMVELFPPEEHGENED